MRGQSTPLHKISCMHRCQHKHSMHNVSRMRSTAQHSAAQRSTGQHSAARAACGAQRSTVPCSAVPRCVMPCNACCVFSIESCTCPCSAGDTTVQLLWRLQHGELPTTTDTKQAVVLIGTNDMTAYHQHQASSGIVIIMLITIKAS